MVLTDDGARQGIAALIGAMRAAVPDMCADPTALMTFAQGGRTASVPLGGPGVQALARFPVMPVAPAVPALVWQLGIPSTFPHPQLAAAFLAWLLSPAGQALMVGAGYAPMLRESGQGAPGGAAAAGATHAATGWTKAFPAGFDLGGLNPPMADLRAVPNALASTTPIVSMAVWKCFATDSDKERAALLAAAEQAANAYLAQPASQQSAFLESYDMKFMTPSTNRGCFGPAVTVPSEYATVVAAAAKNAAGSSKAASTASGGTA